MYSWGAHFPGTLLTLKGKLYLEVALWVLFFPGFLLNGNSVRSGDSRSASLSSEKEVNIVNDRGSILWCNLESEWGALAVTTATWASRRNLAFGVAVATSWMALPQRPGLGWACTHDPHGHPMPQGSGRAQEGFDSVSWGRWGEKEPGSGEYLSQPLPCAGCWEGPAFWHPCVMVPGASASCPRAPHRPGHRTAKRDSGKGTFPHRFTSLIFNSRKNFTHWSDK